MHYSIYRKLALYQIHLQYSWTISLTLSSETFLVPAILINFFFRSCNNSANFLQLVSLTSSFEVYNNNSELASSLKCEYYPVISSQLDHKCKALQSIFNDKLKLTTWWFIISIQNTHQFPYGSVWLRWFGLLAYKSASLRNLTIFIYIYIYIPI